MSDQSPKNQVFNDYAVFLTALLPQAVGFMFHDRHGRLFWQDNSQHANELNQTFETALSDLIMSGQVDEDACRVPLNNCTAYLIRVVSKNGNMLGTLTALVKQDVGIMPYRTCVERLRPAVTTLGRELTLRSRIASVNNRLKERANEYEFLKTLADIGRSSTNCEESLRHILRLAIEHLKLDGAVFVADQHGLGITAGEYPLSIRDAKREILAMELMVDEDSMDLSASLANRTVPSARGASAAWPILDENSKLTGILILSQPPEVNGFSDYAANISSFVASTIEHVIERGFDTLTGLINWPGFEALLQEACNSQLDDCTLVYLDVDQLHVVNDTFGRDTGDDVLRNFSGIVRDVLDGHTVSRVASDGFAALLSGVDIDTGLELGKRICSEFRSLNYASGDRKFRPSVSIGLAPLILDDTDSRGVLVPAQIACQAAKDRGRDRCEVYQNTDASIVRRMDELSLVGSIRNAIEDGQLVLHAQPIVPLKMESSTAYVEILVRMLDAAGNPLEPAYFMGAAERYQLMPDLDRWVISNALKTLAETRTDAAGRPLEFAINLSGQSIGKDEFLDFIRDEIRTSGVAPERLCFEITETAAVANLKKAQAFVEEIKHIGCRFSLDDFGTGLSSFAYLKLFDVDKIKIDGSFVRDASENEISRSMITAIAEIARVMKISTVAEYVQDRATMDLLRNIGIDWAQGYFVGKPQPLIELVAVDTYSDTARLDEIGAELLPAIHEELI
jgi:diguanylate cyclase (GGDEF)-like protein